MCQLLGMNCANPTDIVFSFLGFSQRAGITSDHADGFGIAFFEHTTCHLFVDCQSAVRSPLAEFIRQHPIKSRNVIVHIRKATQGSIELANNHPFMRQLWGKQWVFAHNGDLKNYHPTLNGTFTPVGSTDSERAFCAILQALQQTFMHHEPSTVQIYQLLTTIAPQIAAYGTFNFILCNGDTLFSYATTQLYWLIRAHPFAQAHLIDVDISIDFSQVTTPDDRVAVIATAPLTDNEHWQAYQSGELICFQHGHKTLSGLTQISHIANTAPAQSDPAH